MRRFLKIVGIVGGALVGLVVLALVYVQLTYRKDYSSVEEPRITASKDPAVIAQGEYVVNALAHCQACHQAHEFAHERTLNPDSKDLGAGYKMEAGPFGNFYPANL